MTTTDLDAIIRRLQTQGAGSQSAPVAAASGTGQLGYSGTGDTSGMSTGGGTNLVFNLPSLHGRPLAVDPNSFRSVDDMSFDANYATNYDKLQRQQASTDADYQDALSSMGPEHDRVVRAANDQYGIDAQNLTDKFANNGLLRSGIMERSQGDLGQSLQNRLNDYERQMTESRSNLERQHSEFQQQIQDAIAGLQNERASREAARQQEAARQEAILRQTQPQYNQNGQLIAWPTNTDTTGFGAFTNPGATQGLNTPGFAGGFDPSLNTGAADTLATMPNPTDNGMGFTRDPNLDANASPSASELEAPYGRFGNFIDWYNNQAPDVQAFLRMISGG